MEDARASMPLNLSLSSSFTAYVSKRHLPTVPVLPSTPIYSRPSSAGSHSPCASFTEAGAAHYIPSMPTPAQSPQSRAATMACEVEKQEHLHLDLRMMQSSLMTAPAAMLTPPHFAAPLWEMHSPLESSKSQQDPMLAPAEKDANDTLAMLGSPTTSFTASSPGFFDNNAEAEFLSISSQTSSPSIVENGTLDPRSLSLEPPELPELSPSASTPASALSPDSLCAPFGEIPAEFEFTAADIPQSPIEFPFLPQQAIDFTSEGDFLAASPEATNCNGKRILSEMDHVVDPEVYESSPKKIKTEDESFADYVKAEPESEPEAEAETEAEHQSESPEPSSSKTQARRGRKDSMSNDPSKTFKCNLCPRGFRRQEHLKRHHRSIHTNLKPFKCDECNKTFSRSDNLAQHQRTHGSGTIPLEIRQAPPQMSVGPYGMMAPAHMGYQNVLLQNAADLPGSGAELSPSHFHPGHQPQQ